MSTEETNGVFGEKEPELHETNNLLNGQDVDKDTEDQVSTKSTRYLTLKNRKKTAKTRLTKARNQVTILTTGHPSTKTEIRRAVKKVKAECQIIEEIIYAMKKEVVLSDGQFEGTDADVIVESLEKELSDIVSLVDTTIKAASIHISERIANGEQESEASTILSSKVSENTKVTKLSHSSEPKSVDRSVDRSIPEIRQQEAKDAKERLDKLEEEQRVLQQELQKKSETFELNRQRIEDARSIAKLNEARAKASVQEEQAIQGPTKLPASPVVLTSRSTRVKLKGVELPTFSGEDKTEFEAWNAAFTSVVDDTDIPVKEKMLRLQSCLRGKALETVKDLGFTSHAYERAKEKLTRRYGGKRRQSLAHLVTLRGLNKVRRHNLEDMEELLAIIDRILVAIRDSDPTGEMKSQHLGLTVKEKLPEEYVREYKYWLHDRGEEDSFEKLVEWIETRVQVMDEAKEETGQLSKNQNQKPGERRNRGFGTSSRERHCIVPKCKEDHPPWVCPEFKKLSVSQRKDCIIKTGRCFKCLAAGHLSKDCKRSRKCGVDGCKSNGHSSYLHDPDWKPQERERKGSLSVNGDGGVADNNAKTYNSTRVESISLMVLPAILSNGVKNLKVNVMLDPCSTGSYVSESAAEELQLTGQRQHLAISGTGGTEIKKRSTRVQCSVSSVHGLFSAPVEANVLDNITGTTPAIKWSDLKKDWEHLKSIPFDQVSNRKQIDVLIGSDHPAFHKVLREVPGRHPKDPIARQTPLGWVCFGPTCKNPQRNNAHSHITRTYRTAQTNVETNDLLRKFWELETIGIKDEHAQAMTQDEMKAVRRAQTTQVLKEGRYEIGIPWKDGEPKFKSNDDMALSRLKNLEISLAKKPDIASAYGKIIEDYLEKGYIKKISSTNDEQWLLPHFAVVNNEKTSTKVRIVFDAAAKHNGKSLNDAIYSGPKLQRELVDVLTRFRKAPVAISADISQMFLQVGLIEEDRPYHRFLWRDLDETKQPEVYEFQRLLFGNTASPFCAQHVLHSHAEANKNTFPEAADTVDNAMYVDDILDSCETISEATDLRRQTTELIAGAGFTLKKWMSNEVKVIEDIPVEDRLPGLKIQDGSLPAMKTLGVLWRADRDTFSFQIQPPSPSELPTKRNVLRAIAKLFDPLQFLAPFTIRAKILLQKIWIAGLEWDELLPDNLLAEWSSWTNELTELSCFEIPRPLRLANPTQSSLHTFSDASKDAYAAVSYLVCSYSNHPTTSRLIASKSRVSPLKSVTIPRLELMGAVLACRLAKSLLEILQVDKAIYWTDSTNVLYWIHNQSRTFKPFVANRTAEIQRHTNPDQWRHIPGEQNPADLPTRGLSATDICANKSWIEGASFLTDDKLSWPKKLPQNPPVDALANQEEKKVQIHVTEEVPIVDGINRLDPKRYSSWRRFIRVTAWVKRFIKNCKTSFESRITSNILLQSELSDAKTHWIRQAQVMSFPGKTKDKCLQRFSPQMDERGLLRVDGRLRLADELPYDTRHPIILPKDHPVTKLIIVDAHEKLGHGTGVEHLLTELRSKFWVVKGRLMVRTIVGRCPGCIRRFRAKPAEQKMAPLPSSRVTLPLRAFERIGTDFAGPFLTKQGRGKSRMKRYLCLFTCLATRAVHLEMTYSLDTDSFINAFFRMTSRRGTPSYIVSDNGTNFVAGEKEICRKVQEFDQEKIVNTTTQHKPIEWKFNPPAGPHFGGVFESLIKSAKKALRAILGDAEITDEELHTAICGAEGLLNSRPITYVSSSSDDIVPLTPSHFLVGHLGGQFAPEADHEEIFSLKKRWRRIQQLIGQFWKRWRKEFLPSLNVRGKWFNPKRELAVDDVVLVVEPNAKRGEWPLGRVLDIYRGADNLIRVVKVRVGNNEYTRPVHRLCPLEQDS